MELTLGRKCGPFAHAFFNSVTKLFNEYVLNSSEHGIISNWRNDNLFLYCHMRRFANPANLNGASGWLFVNDPDDIEYVCTANVKNYTLRYLPVSI